jgi:hypothetical protein
MVLTMLVAFGVGSAAAATASIQSTPSTGLANGQVVKVTGSGFVANESMYIIECLATATDATGCDTSTATVVQVKADGTFSQSFPVVTGSIAQGKSCGTTAGDLSGCVLNAGGGGGGDSATTPITFTLPAATTTTTLPAKTYHPRLKVVPSTGLRKGRVVTVSGSGFKPRDRVYIVECLASGSAAAQCNLATTVPKTITAKGLLPVTKFKVVTGKVGTGLCGTKASNLRGCAIDVGNAAKKDAATVRLTFVL